MRRVKRYGKGVGTVVCHGKRQVSGGGTLIHSDGKFIGFGFPLGGQRYVAVAARRRGACGQIGGFGPVALVGGHLPPLEAVSGLAFFRQDHLAFDGVGIHRLHAVHVKDHGVFHGGPLGGHGDVGGGRVGSVCVAVLAAAGGRGVPALQRITRAGGGGQSDGSVCPVGEQREGAACRGGQVGNALLVVIHLAARRAGGPAVECGRGGVAGLGGCAAVADVGDGKLALKSVIFQILRRAVDEALRRHGTAGITVAVKGDGVGIARPFGVQYGVCGGGKAAAARLIALRAGLVGVPAAEHVTRAGGGGQRDGAQIPPGKQVDRGVGGGGQGADALTVAVGDTAASGGGPAGEGRRDSIRGIGAAVPVFVGDGVGTGEAIGGKRLGRAVHKALVAHAAGGGAVAVKAHRIGHAGPLGGKRGIAVLAVDGGTGGEGGAGGPAAVRRGHLPVGKGVSGFGGGGKRFVFVGLIGHIVHRRAAVHIEGDAVLIGLPHGVKRQIRVAGIAGARCIGGGGGGAAGRPTPEGISVAGRLGGAEGQRHAVLLLLRGRRAGAAVGVVGDIIDRVNTERHAAGVGAVALYAQ